MEILKAIILGAVQGTAEFFPISSSGHLVLVPFLFKWEYIPVYYSVVLHFATLLSLVTVFYMDIGRIIKAFFKGLFIRNARRDNPYFKLAIFIIIATIPAALVGYFLQDHIEGFFTKPLFVSIFLLLTAAFLFIGEYFGKKYEKRPLSSIPDNEGSKGLKDEQGNAESFQISQKGLDDSQLKEGPQKLKSGFKSIGYLNAFIIGIGQAIAVLPGISRSGSTISFARLFGIRREECVRFSMLMSIPVIFGAFVLETYKSYTEAASQDISILVNMAIAFVVAYLTGLFAIKFLLKFTKTRNLNFFAIYCIVISVVIFVLSYLN